MSEFVVDGPDEVIDYFYRIVDEMVSSYHISRAEAVARINCHWRGQDFSYPGDLLFHAGPGHWAERIYLEDYMADGQLHKRIKQPPSPDSGCWTVD